MWKIVDSVLRKIREINIDWVDKYEACDELWVTVYMCVLCAWFFLPCRFGRRYVTHIPRQIAALVADRAPRILDTEEPGQVSL